MWRSIALTVGVAGVIAMPSQSQGGQPEEREALLQAERLSVEAANNRDPERLISLYADDASLVLPKTPPVVGKDAIRQWINAFVQNPKVAFSYENVQAETSPDGALGYTVSHYRLELTRPDGSPYLEEGHWAQIWRKQADGSWSLVLETACPQEPSPSGA
jgi:uncharacterized protein (TIGR02246 family)